MTFGPCCEKFEEWERHPDAPDYTVSNTGRVKRRTAGRGTRAGRLLTPYITSKGHLLVHLAPPNGQIFAGWRGRRSKKPKYQVARLVAGFWGKPHPTGDWSDLRWRLHHIDLNVTHNCIENLKWLTQSKHKELHWARLKERQRAAHDNNRRPT